MNAETNSRIDTLEEFLAHAICLENESVERYEELAGSMETHNNPGVAELFRKLAGYGRLHAGEVEGHAKGMRLPRIAPWAYKWQTPESPESGGFEEIHYLMSRVQALQFALHNEKAGRDFYKQVSINSLDPEVCKLAADFTEEESEHVDLLKAWILGLEDRGDIPPEDLDPPNVSE